MKVEELRGSSDQFPKGMRVLAVDDDPICLKLLEALLLRCQYKVTTTDKAIVALELLRENKDKFDLVISDVHMPDMDGFKLLELVGLEMDLPVIMSSANGETQTVMKGITHGACDYLLKPVRIEELRNIWQHVVRRRKFEKRYHNNPNGREDAQNDRNVNTADDQGIADQNGKVRKLKIQIEEDEEDSEDSMQENDDSSSQKKARVVWTVDLHRKFVAAVKQLGVDKAVPKKILDLMNVEKLTRENVASHLQKYRLYLKRLSAVAGQQISVAAVAGGRNSSYLHTGSSNGLRNYYAMGESKQLSTHGSFQTNEISGSLNAPSVLRMHGLLPYQTIQLGGMLKNTSNLCDDLGRVQEIALPDNQQMSLPQRVPVSPKLERFEQPKLIREIKNHLSAGLSDSGLAPGPCKNSFSCIGNNFSLQVNKQPNKSDGLGKYTSVRTSCSTSDLFKTDLQDASCFASICRSDGFQQGVGLTQASANVPILAPISYNELSPITGENTYPITPHAVTRIHDDSATNIKYLHHPTTRNDTWNKISSLSGNDQFECVSVPGGVGNDPSSSNSDIGSNSRQNWKYAFHSNGISSISSSSLLSNVQITDANVQCQPQDIFYGKMLDVDASDHVNFGAPLITENPIVDKANYDGQLNVKREYSLEPTTSCLQTHLDCTGYSLDDLVNAMIKPEPDDVAFLDMDLGFDVYSFGSCM